MKWYRNGPSMINLKTVISIQLEETKLVFTHDNLLQTNLVFSSKEAAEKTLNHIQDILAN